MTSACVEAYPQARQETLVRVSLSSNWEMASTQDERSPEQLGDLRFIPAAIPGTAAAALGRRREWQPGSGRSLDASEYWFRCDFESEPAGWGEEISLELDGIATLSEVWLNGRHILTSSSMYARHRVDVTALVSHSNELLIVCRALSSALRARRTQPPRARWRTRVVSEQQMRWFRTTLLGRAPGFAGDAAPVGPWRPVALVRRNDISVESWSRRVDLDSVSGAGVIYADLLVRTLRADLSPMVGRMYSGEWEAPVAWEECAHGYRGRAVLRIPNVRRWWPHTHGEPTLYPLRVELQLSDGTKAAFDDVPVGFRSVEFETASGAKAGFRINGIPVFCRGVVWTPLDPVGFAPDKFSMRQRLELLRDGGFNLIRLAGTTIYEDKAFHGLCDELGLLLWQDMMFANMDYPFDDPGFLDAACREAECELSRVGRHASSALICGNSEIEQQAGMLGLDAGLGRGIFFGETLPQIAVRQCAGIPYVPSAPSGGDLPFRTRSGVANYFGVGAYLRSLEDVRRADVGFASECLAFANIPEPGMVDKIALTIPGGISPVHPTWKRTVPRDSGAPWDFEDVRDHYLKLLYSLDPAVLRDGDAGRYWELSRMVSGEVMVEYSGSGAGRNPDAVAELFYGARIWNPARAGEFSIPTANPKPLTGSCEEPWRRAPCGLRTRVLTASTYMWRTTSPNRLKHGFAWHFTRMGSEKSTKRRLRLRSARAVALRSASSRFWGGLWMPPVRTASGRPLST